MFCVYLDFVKSNIDNIENSKFNILYKDVVKRTKKADYFSKSQMINTVGMIGIQRKGMKKNDLSILELFGLAIKYEKDAKYKERLMDSRKKLEKI